MTIIRRSGSFPQLVARRRVQSWLALAASASLIVVMATFGTTSIAGAATPKSPIKLMVITPLSGPSEVFPQVPLGASAAAAAINKAGGIQGHPIQIIACDDGFDPNKAEACAREAIADKVLAEVGSDSGEGDSFGPILVQAGIPMVGDCPCSNTESTSSLSYPIASTITQGTGYGALLARLGTKKVNAAYVGIATIQFLLTLINKGLAASNVQLQTKIPVPPTTTDYSSYAAQAASGADGVVTVFGTQGVIQMAQSLYQQGFHGAVLLGTNSLAPAQVATGQVKAATNGDYLVFSYLPSTATYSAGVKQFNSEVNAYKPARGASRDAAMQNAWEAVHVTAMALAKATSINAATLESGLKSFGTFNFGPAAPFNFAKSNSPGVQSFMSQNAYVQIKGGKMLVLFGGKFVAPSQLAGKSLSPKG